MKAAFVYSDEFIKYYFGPSHPLNPIRLKMTKELLESYNLFDKGFLSLVHPKPAEEESVSAIHSKEYMEVVKALSSGEKPPEYIRFGFASADNPPFRGMYDASILYTGASLTAADLVQSGEFEIAFNMSGGLHHAMRSKASGFCIFNDPAIAIARLLRDNDRILYLDLDAHHGDGVQTAFYRTNKVLTISLHESGTYLFPGTGEPHEVGEGDGKGYSVNVPLAPQTDDEVYIWAFEEIVPPLVESFDPEFCVVQFGVDTHLLDPLAHLALTTRGYRRIARRLVELISGRKWILLGGGGYNPKVVCRAWTIILGTILGTELADDVPEPFRSRYGVFVLEDPPEVRQPSGRWARDFAERSVESVKKLVFPIHGITL
jgi:acetoin utilization protein AcuC